MTLASKDGRPLWETTPPPPPSSSCSPLVLLLLVLFQHLPPAARWRPAARGVRSHHHHPHHHSTTTLWLLVVLVTLRSSRAEDSPFPPWITTTTTTSSMVHSSSNSNSNNNNNNNNNNTPPPNNNKNNNNNNNILHNLFNNHNNSASYTFNSGGWNGSYSSSCYLATRSATTCLDRLTERGDEGNQCLYLRGKPALDSVCALSAGKERESMLSRTLLTFCTHHKLESVTHDLGLADPHLNSTECFAKLSAVERRDATARAFYCEFEHGLSRYDCHNRYSVKWDCTDCKAAYKNWVCTMVLPFFSNGHRYLPCRHFCHLVEQQCPYFLPDTKLQYAGESTFLCTDPDIPEDLEGKSPHSSYGDQPSCYLPCHLGMGPRNVPGGIRCHGLNGSSAATSSALSSTRSPSGVSTNSQLASADCGLRCLWHWAALVLFSVVFGVIGRIFLLPPFCLGLT